MSLIETLWHDASLDNILLYAGSLCGVYYIMSSIIEEYSIRRLGCRAQILEGAWLFGIPFMIRSLRAALQYRTHLAWAEIFAPIHGQTAETTILGKRMILTHDPEITKAVLATQFADFGKGTQFHTEWKEFLGDSIFTTDGAEWRRSRRLIRPQLVKDRVSDLAIFEHHMATFLSLCDGDPNASFAAAPSGSSFTQTNGAHVFDICDLFFRMTLDVATDFLFGANIDSMSEPMNDFSIAFDRVQRHQNIVAHMPGINFLLPKSQFRADMAVINTKIQSYVDQVLAIPQSELKSMAGDNDDDDDDDDSSKPKKNSHKYTFLHALAEFTRDPAVLRDQIISVLLAGRDTTSGTLSFALYELARSPARVARLREEIFSVVGRTSPPSYANLNNMPFLNNILRETLRMYPSVPFNTRTALVDTTLPRGGGPHGDKPLGVPKGTLITYSPMVMQRCYYQPTRSATDDTEKGAAAAAAPGDEWAPERWETWHPKGHDYIPFNAGPRICVGQRFAMIEMTYVLVRLFQKYARVESHMHAIDGGDLKLKTDVTVKPGQGVFVTLHRDEE